MRKNQVVRAQGIFKQACKALYVGSNGGFEELTSVHIIKSGSLHVGKGKEKKYDASLEVEPAIPFKGSRGSVAKIF